VSDATPTNPFTSMRDELDALVTSWLNRGWPMDEAATVLTGYAMHMIKAGRKRSLEQVIASIRAAWPLMKVPAP
jgi:hypothetical protein